MSWKVKDDATEAVSLGRVIAQDPNGGDRLEYVTFVPGQEIPESFMEPVVDRLDGDDGDHLWAFVEHVGERQPKAPPVPPAVTSPHTGVAPATYSQMSKDELEAEITRRGLTVPAEGSGSSGNVVKDDLVKFLTTSDELSDNPFGPAPS